MASRHWVIDSRRFEGAWHLYLKESKMTSQRNGVSNHIAVPKPHGSHVRYTAHKSPPIVPVLSHWIQFTSHSIALRSILILSSHLSLGLLTHIFPSGFPNKTLHACLFCRMPRPLHPRWFGYRQGSSTPTDFVCRHVSAYKVWEYPRPVCVLYADKLFVRGQCLLSAG
jgi:hypothetical protein